VRDDRTEVIRLAAARLAHATATRIPCAPVRDLLGPTDIALAYAVQTARIAARLAGGSTVVGRKVGLTSPAVQRQIGVDQPDFGVLFDDMEVAAGQEVPSVRLLQPKAEAEIAFVLGRDLADGELGPAQVREAVSFAVAALEIVDSRIAGWDIAITDTVADNASSGLYVLGQDRVPLDGFEPVDVTMTLELDDRPASHGNGRACLGDPLHALTWLATTARAYGSPLRAGDVVLSGALGPMVDVRPGSRVVATLSGLGTVSATFSALAG
jgi:2-keto-4-pentenoate hydratase